MASGIYFRISSRFQVWNRSFSNHTANYDCLFNLEAPSRSFSTRMWITSTVLNGLTWNFTGFRRGQLDSYRVNIKSQHWVVFILGAQNQLCVNVTIRSKILIVETWYLHNSGLLFFFGVLQISSQTVLYFWSYSHSRRKWSWRCLEIK